MHMIDICIFFPLVRQPLNLHDSLFFCKNMVNRRSLLAEHQDLSFFIHTIFLRILSNWPMLRFNWIGRKANQIRCYYSAAMLFAWYTWYTQKMRKSCLVVWSIFDFHPLDDDFSVTAWYFRLKPRFPDPAVSCWRPPPMSLAAFQAQLQRLSPSMRTLAEKKLRLRRLPRRWGGAGWDRLGVRMVGADWLGLV